MTAPEVSQGSPPHALIDGRPPLLGADETMRLESRLSPERKALFDRTLEIREALGKIPYDVTELVREMREGVD